MIDAPYLVLAYYFLGGLADPHEEIERQRQFFTLHNLLGRLYISKEGINAQMSGTSPEIYAYIDWMEGRIPGISMKLHGAKEHAFPKATIKYRKQLVALDREVDLRLKGKSLKGAQFREMLEEKDPDTVMLDVRNGYEWDVGHFQQMERPEPETFREFPKIAKELLDTKDPKKTRVMMCCTGGIRCEYYSAYLAELGFENVYQLEGGIIQYGLEEGNKGWDGKLFVFDDRMVVPISGDEAPPISSCSRCGAPSDTYYNCAQLDCNALFLSCEECHALFLGTCSSTCQEKPRLRPYAKGAKPFRKMSFEAKRALCSPD